MQRSRPFLDIWHLCILTTVLGSVLALIPSPPASAGTQADVVQVARISADPVVNAILQSRLSGARPNRVLLARADVFADSMASGGLQLDSQLLLLPPDGRVPLIVLDEIERLGATEVVLLGGSAAIPEATEGQLASVGLSVHRIFGASRIETAAAIANELLETASEIPEYAIVVRAFGRTGSTDPTQAFADSLAATVLAAILGVPVLLSETEQLSAATAAVLRDSGIPEVLLIGGEAALGPAVEQGITDLGLRVRRVQGPSRDDTAIAIATLINELVAPIGGVLVVDGTSPQAWVAAFAGAHGAARQRRAVLLSRGFIPANTTLSFVESASLPAEDGVILSAVGEDAGAAVAEAAGFGIQPSYVIEPAPGAFVAEGTQVVITTAGAVSELGGTCLDEPIDAPDEDTVIRVTRGAGATDCRLRFVVEQNGVAAFVEVIYSFVDAGGLVSSDSSLGLVSGSMADISSDGSTIVFVGQQEGSEERGIYRRTSTGIEGLGSVTRRIDVQPDGSPPAADTLGLDGPRVSADGRFVVFESRDPSLDTTVPPVPSQRGNQQTYLYDVATFTMRGVSRGLDGNQALGSVFGDVSDDGTLAVYVAQSSDPGNPGTDTYLLFHDLMTGQVEGRLRGETLSRLDLAGDGSLVLVRSFAPLSLGDTNNQADAFILVPFLDGIERVSVLNGGSQIQVTNGAPSESLHTRISDDGEQVVFRSSTDAIGSPSAAYPPGPDAFVHDVVAQTTRLVSTKNPEMGQLETVSSLDISGDGRLVAFDSLNAPDVAAARYPFPSCGIYVHELGGPLTLVADPRPDPNGATSCESSQLRVSNGGQVVYDTFAGLAPGDDNNRADVYLGGGEIITAG